MNEKTKHFYSFGRFRLVPRCVIQAFPANGSLYPICRSHHPPGCREHSDRLCHRAGSGKAPLARGHWGLPRLTLARLPKPRRRALGVRTTRHQGIWKDPTHSCAPFSGSGFHWCRLLPVEEAWARRRSKNCDHRAL